MPSEREEAKPILKPPVKPTITDKPVPVPIMVIHSAALTDKVSANPWWVGFKHFLYGVLIAGGSVLVVSKGWLTVPETIAMFGAIEVGRKVTKDNLQSKGKNYADVIDKVLAIILELIKLWREKKSGKK